MNILYGVVIIIVVFAIFLLMKAEAMRTKNIYLSFLYLSLGVNVTALPISLFIGGMATDSPDSDNFDFIRGFLFVQTIPFIMLFISILKIFMNQRTLKEK
ncbi:hypothetical protein MHH81_09150 [Psychrobacillus sp. FSL H8-0484]|uniref:hypothetical protein n=1 Tax=Psychrobacillus sp. FSL H8-0484 TaxID=2921390 RepID=UPI0030FC3FA7